MQSCTQVLSNVVAQKADLRDRAAYWTISAEAVKTSEAPAPNAAKEYTRIAMHPSGHPLSDIGFRERCGCPLPILFAPRAGEKNGSKSVLRSCCEAKHELGECLSGVLTKRRGIMLLAVCSLVGMDLLRRYADPLSGSPTASHCTSILFRAALTVLPGGTQTGAKNVYST